MWFSRKSQEDKEDTIKPLKGVGCIHNILTNDFVQVSKIEQYITVDMFSIKHYIEHGVFLHTGGKHSPCVPVRSDDLLEVVNYFRLLKGGEKHLTVYEHSNMIGGFPIATLVSWLDYEARRVYKLLKKKKDK